MSLSPTAGETQAPQPESSARIAATPSTAKTEKRCLGLLPQALAHVMPFWACHFLFNQFQHTVFGRGPCSAHTRSTKYCLGFFTRQLAAWRGSVAFRSSSPWPGLSSHGVLRFGQPLPEHPSLSGPQTTQCVLMLCGVVLLCCHCI